MSKSKGNTVSPDKFVNKYGSDTFRCYLMFMGPFDEGGDWNDKGITGIDRFLKRSYRIIVNDDCKDHNDEDDYVINSTIRFVSEGLSDMKFNTSISKLMELVNHFYDKGLSMIYKEVYVKLLSPFAPHLAEEMWEKIGNKCSVFNESWPTYDESKTVLDKIYIAVQVNGKLRATLKIKNSDSKESVLMLAKEQSNVLSHIEGKNIIKEIYIPGKIVNLVVN